MTLEEPTYPPISDSMGEKGLQAAPDQDLEQAPVLVKEEETNACGKIEYQNCSGGQPETVPEEVSAENGQDDSGEFMVTILARSKLEEQGVGVKRRSSPLSETGAPEAPPSHRDEDVTAESWRQHRKHVFVLSEAGKPIYSRYGSEEALSSTMGVMMALVSFVQSSDNMIRSVYSGENFLTFLTMTIL